MTYDGEHFHAVAHARSCRQRCRSSDAQADPPARSGIAAGSARAMASTFVHIPDIAAPS